MRIEPPRTVVAILVALIGTTMLPGSTAAQSTPEDPVVVDTEDRDAEVDQTFEKPSLLGSVAAVTPGLLLHGSGHWVAGDRSTGYTLLLAEVVGASAAVGGVAILAATGADPRFTPPAALMMMYGVGLFAGSFLADLYGVAAPEGGLGSPVTTASWLDLRSGYRFSYDRIFEDRRHAAMASARYRVGWFGLDLVVAGVAPSGDFEAGIDTRYRLTGPTPGPDEHADDGSYSDLLVGYDYRTWSRADFQTHTIDLFWDNRWDLVRLAQSLDGMFVVVGAGLGLQTFDYNALPDLFTTLLLSRMGLGLDLGESSAGWGELLLYYDHRHDGPTGGFKVTGLGSGTAGHFGLKWDQHVWNGWGFYAETSIGSAWVNSIGLEQRLGGRR